MTLRAFQNPQWPTQCPCITNGMLSFREPTMSAQTHSSLSALEAGVGVRSIHRQAVDACSARDKTSANQSRGLPTTLGCWCSGTCSQAWQGSPWLPSEGSLTRQCKLSTRVRTSSEGDELRFQLCPSVLHSGFRTLEPTLAS